MKYYLIVGEASGDLHASNLMRALIQEDPEAEFRFFGGDLMTAVGGTRVKHYKELAYMGFIPVLLHLRTIFRNMKECKQDIVRWAPDVVILVDYPGFNLKIAEFIKKQTKIPVYYYISPKIWAWKEYRIKNIKRDVDELFSILPFEVEFLPDISTLFIMWVILVWMQWMLIVRNIRMDSRNLWRIMACPKSLLSHCWRAAGNRKSKTTCR